MVSVAIADGVATLSTTDSPPEFVAKVAVAAGSPAPDKASGRPAGGRYGSGSAGGTPKVDAGDGGRWATFNAFVDHVAEFLTPTESKVWVYLFRWCRGGTSSVSTRQMADRLELDPKTVTSALRTLKKTGLLWEIAKSSNKGTASVYGLHAHPDLCRQACADAGLRRAAEGKRPKSNQAPSPGTVGIAPTVQPGTVGNDRPNRGNGSHIRRKQKGGSTADAADRPGQKSKATSRPKPPTTVYNRRKGIATPPPADAVYIGSAMPRARIAGSPFGNPWRCRRDADEGERLAAVAQFGRWVFGDPDLVAEGGPPPSLEEIRELAGRALVCWCAPKLCHGHLLAAIADGVVGDLVELKLWLNGVVGDPAGHVAEVGVERVAVGGRS